MQLLEPAFSPWTSISMDFVTELHFSQGRYTHICVAVDRFTKMTHFILLPTNTSSKGLAEVFTENIWKHHGLPLDIVSDRDVKFTFTFLGALIGRLNIKRKMSTTFHPQTDAQREQINQTLEQYL